MSLPNAARRLGGALALGAALPVQAYQFSLDNFYVERLDAGSGALIVSFNDPFTDGNPPPSAPNLSTGFTTSYFISGFISGSLPPLGSETGGKLRLNRSDPQPTVINSTQFTIEFGLLATNVTEGSTLGLRQGSVINLIGVYDLAAPSPPNEYYGIRLFDGAGNSAGDDDVRVIVRRTPEGDVAVQFWDVDLTAQTIGILSSDVLTSAELANAQIHLKLSVDPQDNVGGSYSLDGGLNFISLPTGTAPTVFNGETFTRAGFLVVSPVEIPEPGTLWLTALALGALVGRYRRSPTTRSTISRAIPR
jgi:hypothetical protein